MSRSRLVLLALLVAGVLALLAVLDPFGWWRSAAGPAPIEPDAAGTTSQGSPASPGNAPAGARALTAAGESRQAVETEPEPGPAVLEIREQAGATVPGAKVFACLGEEIVWQRETGEDGLLEAAADSRQLSLVVAAAGRPLHQQALTLTPGRHLIELAAGERVAGVVLLASGGPAPDLELMLESDPSSSQGLSVPKAVFGELEAAWKDLSVNPGNHERLVGRTDSQGRFAFRGLPQGWRGELFFWYSCRIESASEGTPHFEPTYLLLDRATEDLQIVVALNPVLRGRVLDAASHIPESSVLLMARLVFEEQSFPLVAGDTSDDEGRFAITLRRTDIQQLALHVGTSPDAPAFLELSKPEIPADFDLGDLLLPRLRDVRFLLQDGSGRPIAGGIATLAGVQSAPSGADGLGIVRNAPPEVRAMRVLTDGFLPATVDLPEPLPDPLMVVLEPATRLEVTLVVPSGCDLRGFSVSVQCDAGLFREQNPRQLGFSSAVDHVGRFGLRPFKEDPVRGVLTVAALPDEKGVALFKALRPGHALILRVTGRLDKPLYFEKVLAPLGPTEVRREVVDLGSAWRLFRGRVLDSAGAPISGASLELGPLSCMAQTDAQGEFATSCPEARGTLFVSHSGFATLVREDFVIPEDGAPVELRLMPERRVVITVVDTQGTPMPQAQVFAVHDGSMSPTAAMGQGRFEARGLSDLPFEITTHLAGRFYTQTHDPIAPEARVVVPLHSRLVVEWTDPLEQADHEGLYTFVLRAALSGEKIVLVEALRPGGQTRCIFPRVYPAEYQLTVRYDPSDEERAAGRKEEELIAALSVKVDAGPETVARLPGR